MGLINAFQTAKSEVQEIKEEITSSGMWTVPEGVTEIEVRLFGGGGGGGGSSSGGGGGYMAYAKMTVTPGTQYAITIGAGGAANTAGGATSFGTSLTAQGGQPGTSTGGGNGGTGGGGAVRSNKASYGGNGQYGGGGGGYGHYISTGNFASPVITHAGLGGVYGGNGARGGSSSRYIVAQPGVDSNGGKNYCSYDNTNNGTSTNKYYGAGGGGGYKANGGDAYAMDSSERVESYGAGGGGGWEGGDGGSGGYAANGGEAMGGGGGGYGPLKLAEDGRYKDYASNIDYKIGGRGGLGYGAGGGGAAGVEERLPGAGAPGICIIKYKAVT